MDELFAAFTSKNVWAGVVLTFILKYGFLFISKSTKKIIHGSKVRELRKVKSIRHNQDLVTFEIIKTNAYYLVFMGCCALYLILLTMGPLRPLAEITLPGTLLISSPVFITELLWLFQSGYTKKLIECRAKLNVTRPSS